MTESLLFKGNEQYVDTFKKPDFSEFKNLIIITCVDPRVNPYDQLGLNVGEAITIRNAGGSAEDAVRSIMVPQHFLGLGAEIAVFHHTDCGLSRVTTDEMRDLVKKANPGRDDIAATVEGMHFHHITDIAGSVKTDVQFLATNPLVVKGTKISGWVYDVDTGKISKVTEAVAGL
ncbi:carbonic anhydrase [Mycena vitilis]|nr:carbonic anhydrase [Mycena vitilis]